MIEEHSRAVKSQIASLSVQNVMFFLCVPNCYNNHSNKFFLIFIVNNLIVNHY